MKKIIALLTAMALALSVGVVFAAEIRCQRPERHKGHHKEHHNDSDEEERQGKITKKK